MVMKRMIRTAVMLSLIALVAMIGVVGTQTSLADTVKYRDSSGEIRTLEGTITREIEGGAIFFTYSVGDINHTQLILKKDIIELTRSDTVASQAVEADPDEPMDIPDGATKIAFITLEEMVGPYFNTDALLHSVELLDELPEEEQPDIVVLWIDSGGGALYELLQLTEAIQKEIKPKYRTVAWIESAISAAAMTAWACNEIYMMREGNIGACTGFTTQGGRTKAMDGADLEEILMYMDKVSTWGGHEPLIMRAMQISGPTHPTTLSCDIDEDGNITWYADDRGEHMVSPADEILTLNSLDAEKYGLSLGTTDTKDGLAKLLGCQEWVEVGLDADEYQQNFRGNVARVQQRSEEIFGKMNIAISFAENAPSREEAERQVSRAIRYLRQLRSWVTKAPSWEVYRGWNREWFEEVERNLRDMLRT